MTISSTLKHLRKQKKKTQTDIANYLNMTTVGYGHYETDKAEPDIDKLIKIADFYNVSIDYLVGHNINNGFGYLSNRETALMENFRKLTNDAQCNVIGYIDALLGK